MSIEEVFYLAFPLVCLIVRREKLLPWALLVLIVAGPINRVVYADDQPWGAYAYLSCMDGMAFGCLAALVSARVTLSERVLRVSLVAGAIIAMLVVVFCNENDHHAGIARYGLNFTLLEIGVAMMLVPLGKGLGNHTMSIGTSWLQALGRWSYGSYLFHMLPLIGLIDLVQAGRTVWRCLCRDVRRHVGGEHRTRIPDLALLLGTSEPAIERKLQQSQSNRLVSRSPCGGRGDMTRARQRWPTEAATPATRPRRRPPQTCP